MFMFLILRFSFFSLNTHNHFALVPQSFRFSLHFIMPTKAQLEAQLAAALADVAARDQLIQELNTQIAGGTPAPSVILPGGAQVPVSTAASHSIHLR